MAVFFDKKVGGLGSSEYGGEIKFYKFFLIPLLILIILGGIGFYFYELDMQSAMTYGGILALVGILTVFLVFRIMALNYRIRTENREFKNIVLNFDDSLIVYDREFRILFFNPAAERLFNIRASEVLGRVITPQDAGQADWKLFTQVIFPTLAPTVINRSKSGQYPQVIDLSFDGPEVDFRVTTMPVTDERGNILGFMKTISDRTREQFLLRSKSEFVTVASHQLRGPITNVNWALEALSQDKNLDANNKDLVSNALVAGQLLLKIIEDLINVAKIEEGRFGYTFEPTDLIDFINKILTNVLPQAKRAGIKIYFDRPGEPLPEVMTNQDKLSVVFYNFLDNAIRYNVQNGEVVVKVEKLPDQPFIQVSIKDTGIGIPQVELKKMFMKFFRAENAIKFQTEGSGLGLYINKNIVAAHGGKVWAESEENRGTTFFFTLPTDRSVIPVEEVAPEE